MKGQKFSHQPHSTETIIILQILKLSSERQTRFLRKWRSKEAAGPGFRQTVVSFQSLRKPDELENRRDNEHPGENPRSPPGWVQMQGSGGKEHSPQPPPWLRDSPSPTQQEGRYLHQVY